MQVIFDLQEHLKKVEIGEFGAASFLQSSGSPAPSLTVGQSKDGKYIHVSKRESRSAGVVIPTLFLPMLLPGDRITISGRITNDAPDNYWGIALFSQSAESDQLTQQIAPRGVFSLTHRLEATDLSKSMTIQTTKWQDFEPNYDFFIDSIKVTRDDERDKFVKDEREIVYSLNMDQALLDVDLDVGGGIDDSMVLRLSGNPNVAVFGQMGDDNGRSLHISGRTRDFDGFDIRMEELKLIKGNEYHVKLTGRTAGNVPADAQLMLQGMPGYHWRSLTHIAGNQDFTLSCTLRKSAVEKWEALRVATNAAGSNVAYFIYTIEICPA